MQTEKREKAKEEKANRKASGRMGDEKERKRPHVKMMVISLVNDGS
jgi:hypothetical protein